MKLISKLIVVLFVTSALNVYAGCETLADFDFTTGQHLTNKYLPKLKGKSGLEILPILQAWSIEGIDILRKTRLFCEMPDDLKTDFEIAREKLSTVKLVKMTNSECRLYTEEGANAFAYLFGYKIFFCDDFFYESDSRKQLTVFIHELFHIVGLEHGRLHADRIQVLILLFTNAKNWKEYIKFTGTAAGIVNEELLMCLTHSKCKKKLNSSPLEEWQKMLMH